MAFTSSYEEYQWIVEADLRQLRELKQKLADDMKFRRVCDSVTNPLGYNVLHLATCKGELEICKFLIDDVMSDVNAQTEKGDTPLLLAAKYRNFHMTEYLISCGAEISNSDTMGLTALHCAVLNGDDQIVDLLLTKGANAETDSVCGRPLNCAAERGKDSIVLRLLESQAQPNSISKYLGISPLVSAIYADRSACLLLLLTEANLDTFSNGLSPLAHAIEAKSNSCVQVLIKNNANIHLVSSFGLTPIEHAVLKNNIAAIQILSLESPSVYTHTSDSYFKLMESFEFLKSKQMRYLNLLKLYGDVAFRNQEYSAAMAFYTEAMHHCRNDEYLFSNRSICWERMGESVFALRDAEQCAELKPNWAKAHLRVAVSWHLLERYRLSSEALGRAFELIPEKSETEKSAV